MLLVKTYIAQSAIQGIGLFAGENIKKDQMIWRYQSGFDSTFTKEEANKMPVLLKDFVETYAVLSTETGLWVLGNDDVRFTNHSVNANTVAVKLAGEDELVSMAERDIKKGEEITVNYKTIDRSSVNSNKEYLEK